MNSYKKDYFTEEKEREKGMWISKLVIYFCIFSLIGWIYETIYTIITTKKWDKRGFLYGPVCPIYGVGATAVIVCIRLLEEYEISYTWWQVFLVAFFGSAVLEYSVSWGLEKIFHAYWWDYSDFPLNIHGRICLPASLLFGVVGVGITYRVVPWLDKYDAIIPDITAEFLALVLMALLTMDLTMTVVVLKDFDSVISNIEHNVNQRMEMIVENMSESYYHAISRVKGFRFKSNEKWKHQRIERIFTIRRRNILDKKRKKSVEE